MFKRIGLFLLTNVAVLVVLGVVLNIVSAVFGINFSNVAGKGPELWDTSDICGDCRFQRFHHLFAHEQDDCQIDDGRADD